MSNELLKVSMGEVVEEVELTLAQLCRACELPEEMERLRARLQRLEG